MSDIEASIIRDEYGEIRADGYTEDELQAIGADESKRERFVALIEAKKRADLCRKEWAKAIEHGKELLRVRDKQLAARTKDYPPITAHEAHLAVIEATRRR